MRFHINKTHCILTLGMVISLFLSISGCDSSREISQPASTSTPESSTSTTSTETSSSSTTEEPYTPPK